MPSTVDASRALRRLSNVERQTIFATAVALTKTARLAKDSAVDEMSKVFDRPTPFTLRSIYSTPATKANLSATVQARDFAPKGTPAAKYLLPQVQGGPRRDKRFERALKLRGLMPANLQAYPGRGADLDAYGNMSRGQITKILSALRASSDPLQNRSKTRRSRGKRRNEQYFVARPKSRARHLQPGIYKRVAFAFGSAIKPVIIFGRPARYQVRLRFREVVLTAARRHYPAQFKAALERAFATAR